LVAAGEAMVQRYDPALAVFSCREASLSGRAARSEAPCCRILCFGDSQVKTGVVPQVLTAETGRKAYNLAVCGGPAPMSFFLLRRALDSGARPDAVLVDFKPYLLAFHPRPALENTRDFIGLGECLDLAWAARDPRLFAVLSLSRLLPSMNHRRAIREDVAAALRGAPVDRAAVTRAHVRNLDRNRGALVAGPARAKPGPDLLDPGNKALFPRKWRCDPVNASYLGRFLALAAARGIPVFWLLPPSPPGVQALRERVGSDAAYLRFVLAARDRFPNLVVLDGRRADYGAEVFSDPLHLDRRGAVALTSDVAAAVRSRLDGPAPGARWFVLPAFRERPGGPPVEDLDRSRLASRTLPARLKR
jgi:hypothetical protein